MVFIGNHFKWHAFDLKYCTSIEPDSFENLSKNLHLRWLKDWIGEKRNVRTAKFINDKYMYMNIVYVCNIIYTITAWLSNQRIKPKKKTNSNCFIFFNMIKRRNGTDIPNRVKWSEYKPSYYGLNKLWNDIFQKTTNIIVAFWEFSLYCSPVKKIKYYVCLIG